MRFLHHVARWLYQASFLIALPGTLWSAFEMYVLTLRGPQMLFFSIVHTSPILSLLVAVGLCALVIVALQSIVAFFLITYRERVRVSRSMVGWVTIFASSHLLLLATYEHWSASDMSRIAVCILGLLVISGLLIACIKLHGIPVIRFALVIAFAGAGFFSYQYVAGHYTSPSFLGKNMLEEAIDPDTGSLEKWNRYMAAGGLNKASSFYGMAVSEVKPVWDGNKLKEFILTIDSYYPPSRVQAAMNKACAVSDSDWKVFNKDEIMGKEALIAKAEKGRHACSMFVSPLGSSVTFDSYPEQK